MQDYDQLAANFEYVTSSTPKSNGKVSLDDFIYELKQRNEEMCDDLNGTHLRDLDVYLNGNENHDSSQQNGSTYDRQLLLTQLAKKEKDLILAAELGKALLDRNEELTRTNEQINEEYTRNLEVRLNLAMVHWASVTTDQTVRDVISDYPTSQCHLYASRSGQWYKRAPRPSVR